MGKNNRARHGKGTPRGGQFAMILKGDADVAIRSDWKSQLGNGDEVESGGRVWRLVEKGDYDDDGVLRFGAVATDGDQEFRILSEHEID